jgi:hypothetical protein
VTASKKGTVKWSYLNDDGCVHEQYIPNTHYNKESPFCLYSPQHVAQIANDHYPNRNGTCSVTYADTLELQWDQLSQKRTIKVDPLSNIFLMRSAPAFDRFHAYNSTIEEIEEGMHKMHNPSIDPNTVSDDESDNESQVSEIDSNENIVLNAPSSQPTVLNDIVLNAPNNQPTVLNEVTNHSDGNDRHHPDLPDDAFESLEFDGTMHILPTEDIEIQANTPQAQLLAWHYRLGHIPFAKIRQMAARGDLPM